MFKVDDLKVEEIVGWHKSGALHHFAMCLNDEIQIKAQAMTELRPNNPDFQVLYVTLQAEHETLKLQHSEIKALIDEVEQ